uniref:NADP-dependent glyceraldehyde-3-phosphate dehydrogenase n=1 Tax=Hemiselmis tepida TaxID=464990 RepID=A0A7S0Z3S3_9CRYP|mmetsp:Transcript_7575/g.19431  ORF Transcript_7575/g.19431 Transcript_7575/m.19431 type:complete len:554 (+) Transcript_7575:680-2341(+)
MNLPRNSTPHLTPTTPSTRQLNRRFLAPGSASLLGLLGVLSIWNPAAADNAGACVSVTSVAGLQGGGGAANLYINGVWKPSQSGKTLSVLAPFNGSVVYHVQAATRAEIDEAFDSARAAQKEWAKTPLWKRAELLKKAASEMRLHAPAIAEVMVNEVSKPRKDAIKEVMRTADLFEFTAEEGVRAEGTLLTSDSFVGEKRNKLALVSRIPLGVVVAIPPFNYPLNLAGSKVAPALMAGNSLVMKPPSAGAVTGLVGIGAVMHLAGAPKGLVNVVTGKGSEIGDYLTQHKHASAISFTGGATGIKVAKGASMIPMQMELGGKDPALVLPDADLDLAAASIVKGAFSYSGQRCTAVKVAVMVTEDVYNKALPLILAGVKKLKVGHPDDEGVDITSVIDAKSADFIESLVKDAVSRGATLQHPPGGFKREGNLIWPCVLTGVTPDMRLFYEEQFGPVLPIAVVGSAEEAIELCNDSPLGLQASVFTRDIDKAITISDALHAGTVQINGAPARGPDHFPFQGFKDSGIGSQGVRWSLDAMSKVKSTVINLGGESYAS